MVRLFRRGNDPVPVPAPVFNIAAVHSLLQLPEMRRTVNFEIRGKFFDALGADLVYSAAFNPMMKVADHEHNP
jgi:hypothetical protein